MSFFAAEPSPVPGQTIVSHAFWPIIDTAQLREVMRLDGTVTDARLAHAAINAVANVNADLSMWKAQQVNHGYQVLAEIPAEQINNQSVLLHHYARAVYCLARANLIERLRDYDATKQGETRAESLEQTIIDLRRDARFAVRAILGIPHTTVELI